MIIFGILLLFTVKPQKKIYHIFFQKYRLVLINFVSVNKRKRPSTFFMVNDLIAKCEHSYHYFIVAILHDFIFIILKFMKNVVYEY